MQIQTLRVAEGDDWKRLVEAWGDFLDRYEMLSRPDLDVGYWHREESLTGLLASAAWKSGGAGLVEFSTERTRMLPEESGTGYGDAYLWIGRQWYTVEAKLCWSAPGIEASLVSARDDLLSLRAEDRAGGPAVLAALTRAGRGDRAGDEKERRHEREGDEKRPNAAPHGSDPSAEPCPSRRYSRARATSAADR